MSDISPNLKELFSYDGEKSLHPYMNKVFYIDEHTTYYLDKRNRLVVTKNSIREDLEDEHDADVIIKYTKKDLEKFYEIPREMKLIVKDGKHIIIHEANNMLFVPLCNRYKNIVEYACSEFTNFDKVSVHAFSRIITKNNKIYVQSSQKTGSKYMQEIIFGRKARKGYKLDHTYSNGLDNRSAMLRELTDSENGANKEKIVENSTSKYKGVSKVNEKWQIIFLGNHIGMYNTEIEAAKVWNVYAIDKYKNIVPLNREEDDIFLSETEIDDILKNGIPEEFKRKEKVIREYPPNIGKTGELFHYKIKYKKEAYYKSFKTLEETIENLELLKLSFTEDKQNQRDILEENIENFRNKKGCAVIRTYNIDGKINGNIEVDDEDWITYIHNSWSLTGKYPSARINGSNSQLHLIIYGDMDKEYDNTKDDRTVDHKESLFDYTGVAILNGNFHAQYQNSKGEKIRKGPFKILEDAARMYNTIALEHDKNSRLNLVLEEKTTLEDIYNKKNLSLEIIDSICSIKEMHVLFKINKDWKKKGKVVLYKMLVEDIQKYKNIAKKLFQEEQEDV